MKSGEISYKCSINDEEQQTDEMENIILQYSNSVHQYLDILKSYGVQIFKRQQLDQQMMKKHKIRFINMQNSILLKQNTTITKYNCCFSILQTLFNGIQYIYQIMIGPFLLNISVLNLNRNSDDNDQDIEKQQIGSGGFGSVRVVRIRKEQFAIKRIPFKYKLDPSLGYDLQAESNQQYQLRRCLREFCMFKICSLLGIGPKCVQGSYDLICFNNCIQFRMQLCETVTSNQFYINNTQRSINKIKNDLLQKLIKLHSFNIVHRDIKPQNLLYSPSRQQFIIGDFGMNMIIKQSYQEKTYTKFAGTPEYIGQEMKQLLDGKSGYVNLYLNDYLSLKKTFNYLQNILSREKSEISRNSMSYYQESLEQLSDFQNFQNQQQSDNSFRIQTDGAYSSTGHSIITFPTNSTQAPKKLATPINHHESQIIHIYCRQLYRGQNLSIQTFYNYFLQDEKYFLADSLLMQIICLFFDKRQMSSIGNKFKQWKNASRHYGPKNQHTIFLLNNVIQHLSQAKTTQSNALCAQLKLIKSVIQKGSKIKYDSLEMKYYRSIGNIINYTYSFINYIREQILNLQTKAGDTASTQAIIFIAKQYLFLVKNENCRKFQINLLNQVICKYIKLITSVKIVTNIYIISQFWFSYLKTEDKLDYEDIACYIILLIEWDPHKKLNQQLMSSLLSHHQNNQNNIQFFAVVSTVILRMLESNRKYWQMSEKYILKALSLIPNNHSDCIVYLKIQLLIFYLSNKKYDKIILLNKQLNKQFQICKDSLISYDYYLILKNNIIAEALLNINQFTQSECTLKQCWQSLQLCHGFYKYPKLTFNIGNNLSYLYQFQKQYLKAIQYLRHLLTIFRNCDLAYYYYVITYLCQNIIRINVLIGIKSNQDILECRNIISIILETIYINVSDEYIQSKMVLIGALEKNIQIQTQILIKKQAIAMLSTPDYKKYFISQYLKYNLDVGRYLTQSKLNRQSLKYLWNYIELKNQYPSSIKESDYQIFNNFTGILMRSNSYRRAAIFLRSYIFKIPSNYFKQKKRAITLMYKVTTSLNMVQARYYYELIRNSHSLLLSKRYEGIIQKQKSIFKRLMIKKWYLRV